MGYAYPILSVFLVSLLSFVGVFTLSIRDTTLKKYVFVLVSLAAGALIGDAFLHLIPEALSNSAESKNVFLSVIFGILMFFILEKFLHWHHHEGIEDKEPHPVGVMILASDSLHNFIDGILIGASFIAGKETGIATTLAIILHEIPQEIGDFGVLINSGFSKFKALFLNFLSALFAVAGTVTSLFFGNFSEKFAFLMLPVAAGGFIYVALSDLIPQLHKTKSLNFSLLQFISILIGLGSMILLLLLET